MSRKPFTEALQIAQSKNIKHRTTASLNWYRQYIKNNMTTITNYSDIKHTQETQAVFKIEYGRMYTFMYDPKFKDKLPYYDISPLVIPFKDDGDSFLAFNLHYIPLGVRAKVMDYLFTINGMKATDNIKNLKRYQIFNDMGKNPMFTPCIKRYLKSHVRSRFLRFKPEHWEIAVFLPSANFRKGSQNQAYSDSRKIIHNQHRKRK